MSSGTRSGAGDPAKGRPQVARDVDSCALRFRGGVAHAAAEAAGSTQFCKQHLAFGFGDSRAISISDLVGRIEFGVKHCKACAVGRRSRGIEHG